MMSENQQIKLFAEMLNERAGHYSMTASAYETDLEKFGSSPENVLVWRTRSETIKRIRDDFLKFFGSEEKAK